MTTITRTMEHVVVKHPTEELYWGVLHQDGKFTVMGWGDIASAELSDARYCESPIDLTYQGSHYTRELSTGKLVKLTITTTYQIEEHDPGTKTNPTDA